LPVPPGTVLIMADLRHVWVCAKDLQLVRADRIITLVVAGYHGGAESADGIGRTGARGIYAEIEGGTDGDFAQKVRLADADAATAGEMLAQLAGVISAAAAHDAAITFVYPERGRDAAVQWTSGPELPPRWPAVTGVQVSRLRD
jgi:hypothetical protein